MQKNHTCKILAIGIIVLFMGIGIHPVFAVEDKTSDESLTIDSKNENPVTTTGEVYENIYCFVMGKSKNSWYYGDKVFNRLFIGFKDTITFGYCPLFGKIWPAEGWIYTSNVINKWGYIGYFYGANGKIWDWIPHGYGYFYIGIKNFRGIAFVKKGTYFPSDIIVRYIGFAESVKIKVYEG